MTSNRLPDFMVIGAMKSGTTTLCRYLGEHPGAYIPPLKEPDFFVTQKNWSRGFDWYSSLFDDAPPGVLLGEGSTSYTKAPMFTGIPARIRHYVPDVKLIYLLRDPIERMTSDYAHNVIVGRERRPAGEVITPESGYLMTSLYGHQLATFQEHFPPEQILVLLTEDLRDEATTVIGQTEDFLGLPHHDFSGDERRDHATSDRRRDRRMGTMVRNSPFIVDAAKRMLPAPLMTRVRRGFTRNFDAAEVEVPPSVFDPMLATLAEDRALLQSLRPLDLSSWSTLGVDA